MLEKECGVERRCTEKRGVAAFGTALFVINSIVG